MSTTTPTGMKIMARTIKEPITHLGVRIGCQALSRCCLNAVSANATYMSQCQVSLKPKTKNSPPEGEMWEEVAVGWDDTDRVNQANGGMGHTTVWSLAHGLHCNIRRRVFHLCWLCGRGGTCDWWPRFFLQRFFLVFANTRKDFAGLGTPTVCASPVFHGMLL